MFRAVEKNGQKEDWANEILKQCARIILESIANHLSQRPDLPTPVLRQKSALKRDETLKRIFL